MLGHFVVVAKIYAEPVRSRVDYAKMSCAGYLGITVVNVLHPELDQPNQCSIRPCQKYEGSRKLHLLLVNTLVVAEANHTMLLNSTEALQYLAAG